MKSIGYGRETVRDAVKRFLVDVGTDLSAEAFIYLETLDDVKFKGLKSLRLDPNCYQTPIDFAKDYCVQKIVSKWDGLLTPGYRKDHAALRDWLASERRCRSSNERIRSFRSDPSDPFVSSVIATAKWKIGRILGPFSYEKVLSGCRWGPGATTDVSRRGGPDKKMTPPFSVTSRALQVFLGETRDDLAWNRYILKQDVSGPCCLTDMNIFNVVEDGEWFCVPKDAFTDRSIEKQPTINSWLQQGAGRYIRRQLRIEGINLDDQSLNQTLARLGFAFRFSTLDLKSASDSECVELVHELLPIDWAHYLDAIRAHFTKVKGIRIKLNKFVAMGCAFAFELESLLFYALAWACAQVRGSPPLVQVFGDDIICLEEDAPDLIRVLNFCGFEINESKTYIDGKFRESCGKHYFEGQDVTPFYLKKTDDSLAEKVRFANRLELWSRRIFGSWRCEVTSKAWKILYESTKSEERPRIPHGYLGDDGFRVPSSWLGEPDPNRGYRCVVLRKKTPKRKAREGSLYPIKLRNPEFSNPHPRGWESVGIDGKYHLQSRWVPLSSLIGEI